MENGRFHEKLEYFKSIEKPEVVLLIVDESERIKLLIAWTNTLVFQKSSVTELSGETDNEMWDWLWENTDFYLEELRLKSSLSKIGFESRLQFLISNRIIYPDGTLNSYVQKYLRDMVLKYFDAKPKKKTAKK